MDQPVRIIPHPNSQNITSALAIDSSGLPLGQIIPSSSPIIHPSSDANSSSSSAAAYSAISKLASKLDRNGDGNNPTSTSPATVIIEGEREATLIKEYHGRTVVFTVPVVGKGENSAAGGAS
ncbi:hypothetical protein ACHAWO_007363 [Cyclotella atomus]|uniref:Late endosomal/lysosomal adaptor and MAPK and MTOR activator 5 n=1 Tax=Cyclotella atomus TaxID=382360 RepID=A0ABD3NJ92_9STRA